MQIWNAKLSFLWRTFRYFVNISTINCTTPKTIDTAQKMKFSIKDFFSKCDQIHSYLRIWSHLLKRSLMESVIFCAVWLKTERVTNKRLNFAFDFHESERQAFISYLHFHLWNHLWVKYHNDTTRLCVKKQKTDTNSTVFLEASFRKCSERYMLWKFKENYSRQSEAWKILILSQVLRREILENYPNSFSAEDLRTSASVFHFGRKTPPNVFARDISSLS